MRVITIASGSSGNCTLVSDGGAFLLIDAGISARRIALALAARGLGPGDISGILITHEHSDHIGGLATLTKKYQIPLFAPGSTARHICRSVFGASECMTFITPGEKFSLAGLEILPFRTPHDTPESVGYTVRGNGSMSLCTDLGHVPDEVYESMRGSDIIMLESNHDEQMLRYGAYPAYLKRRILSKNGHLSNEDSAQLAAGLVGAGTTALILAHLSRDNNTPEIARRTAATALAARGYEPGVHIRLEVAPPDAAVEVSVGEAEAESCSA